MVMLVVVSLKKFLKVELGEQRAVRISKQAMTMEVAFCHSSEKASKFGGKFMVTLRGCKVLLCGPDVVIHPHSMNCNLRWKFENVSK